MNFDGTDLAGIIYKLGPAMNNNRIIHWSSLVCCVGVSEINYLFNTFRDSMNSLEELHIDCDESDGANGLDDGIMAGCIPSLAACMGMQKLKLDCLNMGTSSCAALSVIFPRMASLRDLNLRGNSIDDDCARVLVRGLAACQHLRSLSLACNGIGDDGLDVLIQGLPASVDALNLWGNEVTLARRLLLLRFKTLHLTDNAISSGGARVIAESLVNPECRLEELHLYCTNIGDEGAAILASSLRNNQRLVMMDLYGCTVMETGWNAFSPILCDTSSINATFMSNHTLQCLGSSSNIPQDVRKMLDLNSVQDKSRVAANKILQAHRHLDMRPLFGWEFGLLPYVATWLESFAESRLDLKLSALYEFVRAMPMKVTNRVVDKTKGEKRKLSD